MATSGRGFGGQVEHSDFLGKCSLEITRGTNGFGIYNTHPLQTLTLDRRKACRIRNAGIWRKIFLTKIPISFFAPSARWLNQT